MNKVDAFWLTVTNIALGIAVLAAMCVVVVSIIEEAWTRLPAMHPRALIHRFRGHPNRIIIRGRWDR